MKSGSHSGGRSFYLFDFDDNIAFLTTPSYLFHKVTGAEVSLTSREFTTHSPDIGRSGPWADYEIRLDPNTGSFRNFRDQHPEEVETWLGRQRFIEDLAHALGLPEVHWQGPSWLCFHHAVLNARPLSLITARGHHPQTLKEGISLLVTKGHLPHEPNYLGLYPVSHPEIGAQLAEEEHRTNIPELKRRAIRASVERAIEVYGYSHQHRFGMSDDDPRNVISIVEEMTKLKREYPQMSFFVFETAGGKFIRREVLDE